MTKFATAALLLVTLAGCGHAPVSAAATQLAARTSAAAATSSLVVTSAHEVNGDADQGAQTFTISGHDANGAFNLCLNAVNPKHERYVALVASLTLNGKAVSPAQFEALGAELDDAKVPASVVGWVDDASVIIRVSRGSIN